jgi:hypothetical protein
MRPIWRDDYLVLKRPDINVDAELPGIIRGIMRASVA